MKYLYLFFALIFLSGCYGDADYRTLTDSEWAAISITKEALGQDFECTAAERENIFIRTAPQRVIARHCTRGRTDMGVMACVHDSTENGLFTPGSNMHVSWDSGWNLHHNLVRHEITHVLLGCMIGDRDGDHERREYWEDLQASARINFLAQYPIPEVDPYNIEERPWDLSGTTYEGQDCEVQPTAWIESGIVPGCRGAAQTTTFDGAVR